MVENLIATETRCPQGSS